MPNELEAPVVVDFPLRGERWMAVTTPASRVPSNGTDLLVIGAGTFGVLAARFDGASSLLPDVG